MKKAVIFDIDGVLAKISKNEDGTLERGYRDYDKVGLDEPVKELFGFIECYLANRLNNIFLITGRKNLCLEETKEWILKHFNEISNTIKLDNFDDYFKLFMRPNHDHRPAFKLKKEIYEKKIKGKYNVVMAFDDDPEVCKMYKKESILTMQVMTRNFRELTEIGIMLKKIHEKYEILYKEIASLLNIEVAHLTDLKYREKKIAQNKKIWIEKIKKMENDLKKERRKK